MGIIKIAVAGLGLGGRLHIESLRRNYQASLDSIVAPYSERNKEIAKKERVRFFNSLEQCIKETKPDGVIIASPNNLHMEQTEICIRHNTPVLLEKPITTNLKDGIRLCRLVNKKKAKVLVGHHRAHSNIIKKAQEIIQQGLLGKIVSVTGSAQFYKPDNYFEEGAWRKSKGGGPLLINLIHEVDILRRLIGEISKVQAFTSNKIRRFEVEDTAAINFVFENHALGSFILSDTAACSSSWELTAGENKRYPKYNNNCYLITGTNGSLSIPSMVMKYYPEHVKQSWWTPLIETRIKYEDYDPIALQLNNFIEIINNESKPLVTVEDGFRNMAVIEAIRISANNAKAEIVIYD